jgi:hypothetical protein
MSYIQADRDTPYLVPPSVDEWLPANHLARFILEVIEQLDLSRLTQGYARRGSKAHHPRELLDWVGMLLQLGPQVQLILSTPG